MPLLDTFTIQKDCPGWTALPVPYKIMLGDWAVRQIAPP
jgi:hypothetical protein